MARVTLIEAAAADPKTAEAVTVRLAGAGRRGYTHKGFNDWLAGVATKPTFTAAYSYDQNGPSGAGAPVSAKVVFVGSRAGEIAGLYWKGAAIAVSSGDDRDAAPAWTIELTGTVTDVEVEAGALTFTVSDRSAALYATALPDAFAGTGGVEGGTSATGRPKRRSWGRCFNVEGRALIETDNVFEFGDPARGLQSLLVVRDKGAAAGELVVVAWAGSIAATLAALRAKTPPKGGAAVAPSIACAKWWTRPAGPLTADIEGEIAVGYASAIGDVAAAIVAAYQPAMTVVGAAAFNTVRPGVVGIHAGDPSETIAMLLDRLLLPASTLWVVAADGTIVLRPITFDAPVAQLRAVDRPTRQALLAPLGVRKLGYRRNNRQHGDGEIAAALRAADVVYDDGTTGEEMKPAEAGADVTGKNTSKDTAAVAGRPAAVVVQTIDGLVTKTNDLTTTYGNTASSAAFAQASQAARDAAIAAQGVTQAARDQAVTATTAGVAARDQAIANANAAAQSAGSANGYATTASGAATIATQKASDAGEYAATAAAEAETASTKAGDASKSASDAAVSESNSAANSAAAFSSATLSASARDAAQAAFAASYPKTVDPVGRLAYAYERQPSNYLGPAAGWPTAYLANWDTTNPITADFAVFFRTPIAKVVGRTYRAKLWLFSYASNCRFYGAVRDFASPDRTGIRFMPAVSLTEGLPPSAAPTLPGFVQIGFEFTVQDSHQALIEPIFGIGPVGSGPVDNLVHVGGIELEDVTESAAARAQAVASASSATSAAASQAGAGKSASASRTSEVNAATSAKAADGYASAASASATSTATSASDAEKASSTAAGYSREAASSRDKAGGYANAASSAASIASGHADDAGSSATAARKAQVAAAGYATDSQGSADASEASAASASGYAAAAVRSAGLAASVGGATLNANPAFAAYTTSPGPPDNWIDWSYGSTGTRAPGQAAGFAYRVVASADRDQGLFQTFYLTAGDQIIEADVWCEAGDWRGAGVLVARQDNGSALAALPFSQVTDLSNAIGAGGPGVRRWRTFVSIPYTGAVNFYLMTNYSAFGTRVAKTLTWFRCGLRPANEAESAGKQGSADAATALSRIASFQATQASQNTAFAKSIDSLTTRVGSAESNITDAKTAASDATSAAAQVSTTLSAAVRAASNLLVNGDASNGLDGWSGDTGAWRAINDAIGPHFNHPATSGSGDSYIYRDVAITPGRSYSLSCEANDFGGGSGQKVKADWCDNQGQPISEALVVPLRGSASVGGRYAAPPAPPPSNAARLRVYLICARSGSFDATRLMVQQGPATAIWNAYSDAVDVRSSVSVLSAVAGNLASRVNTAVFQVVAQAGTSLGLLKISADGYGSSAIGLAAGSISLYGTDGNTAIKALGVDATGLVTIPNLAAGQIVARNLKTDQGVDLAAIVPGSMNWKTSGAQAVSGNGAKGNTYGPYATTGLGTLAGHEVTVAANVTLRSASGSANAANGDPIYTNVTILLAYRIGTGGWQYLDIGQIQMRGNSAAQTFYPATVLTPAGTGAVQYGLGYRVESGDAATTADAVVLGTWSVTTKSAVYK